MQDREFQIITFYEFKELSDGPLNGLKDQLKSVMQRLQVKGTVILATEGFNATVCGTKEAIGEFVIEAGLILQTEILYKSSLHPASPFRRIYVKIKPEIVTLKKDVDISAGRGTHVSAGAWNSIVEDPNTLVLDARNDYEFKNGTFRGAANPRTRKFSDLPNFVSENLDPTKHKKIAMFCTGGIRCEKFAPYMKQLGFDEVYQLDGGILGYLEVVRPEDSLWQGECFVFDGRVTVDHELKKGTEPDRSLEPLG